MVNKPTGNRKKNRPKNRQRLPGPGTLGVTRPLRPREQRFSTVMTAFVSQADISASSLTGALYTTVGGFANSTGFLSVFDQYRILEVTYEFIPQCTTSFITGGTVSTVAPTSIYNTSILATAVDQDDATTPANEAAVLAHESAILHGPFIRTMSRTYKPMVAASVYQTGGFGGYESQADAWIDSASVNVQHYGLKWSLYHGSLAPVDTVFMSIYCQALIEFRKVF